MFTGIIQAIGRIETSELIDGDVRLRIATGGLDLADLAPGDSIAVAGVCLTAIAHGATHFTADVSNETLTCTTLGALRVGDRVNLEKALRLADRLGGHLVSGHVDGLASVVSIHADARSQRWEFELPMPLARYVAAKGSIAINGISLTVNSVDGCRFGVNLIPHTVEMTAIADCRVGDSVNIEVDMMARYVERLRQVDNSA